MTAAQIAPAPAVTAAPVPAAPLVLAADSWQARLVRKAEALHALRKPGILVVKTGDGPVTFWRVVPDGRGE